MLEPDPHPRFILHCSASGRPLGAIEGLERMGYGVIRVSGEGEAIARLKEFPAIEALVVELSPPFAAAIREPQLELASRLKMASGLPLVFLVETLDEPLTRLLGASEYHTCLPRDCPAELLAANLRAAIRCDEERKAERILLERGSAIIHTAMDAYWLTDPKGRILEVNEAACSMSGYTRRELLGKRVSEIDVGLGLETLIAENKAVMDEGEGRIESRHRRKDGSVIEVELSSSFLPLEGGRFVSFIRDITERRRAEKALRDSEGKYRSLIERSSDIIYALSPEGRFTFVSPSWTTLLGHPAGEVLGRSIADFIHPEDLPACSGWLEGLRKGLRNQAAVREYRARRADGSWRWHSSNVVPIIDNGKVTGFEGIAKDITERKEMEDRLRAKSEELDLYFNSALDLLCIADTGGHFLKVNKAWGIKLGYSAADLEGRLFLDFVHPDDLEATLAAISALKNQEEILSFTNRYRCADGSWRWLEWRSHPSGDTIYAVARDISDRLAAEEKVKALLSEKELVLKEVHHRIKNNMTAVNGLLSLHASSISNPEAIAAIEDTQGRLRSMMVLYDRLYRSENPMAISVADYIPALVEEVASNFPASAHLAVETRAGDFILDSRLIQPLGIIVNELVSNVMKYAFAPRQGGHLLVTVFDTAGTIELAVEDDGNGLPPEVSMDNSTGFGLGLVKGLAEQLKGEARVEKPTEWEKGTRFVVSFPR